MEFGRQMFQTTVIRADHAIAASTLRRSSANKVIAISEWHVQEDDVEVKVEKDEHNWEPGRKVPTVISTPAQRDTETFQKI